MEETTGAPSSFAALSPRRLRASSRDGGGVVNRPPSPLTMLLSRHTRRREFIAGLFGGPAWSAAAWAQQRAAMPVIGVLGSASSIQWASRMRAFREGLSEAGFVDGKTIAIEYRWAEGRNERLAELAADLVRREVTALAVLGNTHSVLAAQAATNRIP